MTTSICNIHINFVTTACDLIRSQGKTIVGYLLVYYYFLATSRDVTLFLNLTKKLVLVPSVAYRRVSITFERYGHTKKCAQKVIAAFFSRILYVKTK